MPIIPIIDLSQMKNNREKCIALINNGGATKQSLMDDLGINDKSLASLFSQLRLMGHFNLKNEDGSYRLGTEEEYEAARPVGKGSSTATPKTPEEVLEMAAKRESKAASALTNAKKRYEADPSQENELRVTIADAQLTLASILLGKAEEAAGAIPAPESDEDVDGVELD